jgi:hypothetical protein
VEPHGQSLGSGAVVIWRIVWRRCSAVNSAVSRLLAGRGSSITGKVEFLVRRETKLMNLVLSLKVRQLCVPHE